MADRNLVVRLIGDASSLTRTFLRSSSAATKFNERITISARASANAQIQASAKKTARLREEIAAYNTIAASAVRGSEQQVAATQLSARAQKSLSRSLGVSAHESRQLALSSASVERNFGRATRGALAGSGIFRGLGRSIAFASGGFLAFASASQFLRNSIDAAREMAVTQKQLSAQFRASGQDLGKWQAAIDTTANKLALLAGIENDEVKAGFITIFRTTGNVSKALRDTATAADLARAKHLSFAQASLIIAKTEAGNTTLLRRQGFQIGKNVTSEQALAKLRRVVAGQAEAGTTAQERFGAVLHNTEEIIGGALLPILNRYLTSASKWLTQMNESGKLQKDVNAAVKTTGEILSGVKAVLTPVVLAFKALGEAVGGTKNEVELLGGAFLILKARARLTALGVIGSEIAGVGTQSLVAAGEVSTLGARLATLAKIGTIAIALNFIPKAKASTNPNAPSRNPIARTFANLPVLGGLFSQVNKLADKINDTLGLTPAAQSKVKRASISASALRNAPSLGILKQTFEQAKLLNPKLTREAFDLGQSVARAFLSGTNTQPAGSQKPLAGLSLTGKFNLAEFALAKAQLTAGTADDRRQLVTEAAITQQQIKQAKTLKEKTQLTQQLAGLLSQIRGIDSDTAAQGKQAAEDAKAAAKATQERLAAARNARQFRALGLDATGSPLVPGVKALRRELGTITSVVAGTFLDTGKTKSVLSRIRRVLGGGLGALSKDVRSTIKQMLDDLDQQLKSHAQQGPETKFQKADLSKVLGGLGLSPAEFRAVRARISQIGAGGTVPRSSIGAPAFAGTGGTVIVEAKLLLDGRQLASNTTKHQQKSTRRNPPQRRGPHAGQ